MDFQANDLWSAWAMVAGAWFVTVALPGPNFIATVHRSVSRSRTDGIAVASGIGFGTAIWAAGSLLGLGLLFQTAGWLYAIVKYLGAAYLVFVGLKMIFTSTEQEITPAGSGGMARGGLLTAFRLGLLTDLANPKAAAFFTSLFAVAVPPGAPAWFGVILVATVVAIAWCWYTVSAMVISIERVAEAYRRAQKAISRVTGVLFCGFGAKLATDG